MVGTHFGRRVGAALIVGGSTVLLWAAPAQASTQPVSATADAALTNTVPITASDGSCDQFPSGSNVPAGEYGWHFVVGGPTDTFATLSASFTSPALTLNYPTDGVSVQSGKGVVFYTTQDTLTGATATINNATTDHFQLSGTCLGSGDGTPTPSATPTPDETPTPEETPTPTSTPEETPTPTSTPEETPTPTSTPEESPTPTSTPEESPTPTPTPTPTGNVQGQTSTPTPSPTPHGGVLAISTPGTGAGMQGLPLALGLLMIGLGIVCTATPRRRAIEPDAQN